MYLLGTVCAQFWSRLSTELKLWNFGFQRGLDTLRKKLWMRHMQTIIRAELVRSGFCANTRRMMVWCGSGRELVLVGFGKACLGHLLMGRLLDQKRKEANIFGLMWTARWISRPGTSLISPHTRMHNLKRKKKHTRILRTCRCIHISGEWWPIVRLSFFARVKLE